MEKWKTASHGTSLQTTFNYIFILGIYIFDMKIWMWFKGLT